MNCFHFSVSLGYKTTKTEYKPYLPSNTGGAKRGQKATPKSITQKESSKTFTGVAKAMAEQWSVVLTACT